MPKVLEKLKDKLMGRGLPKASAYAIATDALQKRGVLKRGSNKLAAKSREK